MLFALQLAGECPFGEYQLLLCREMRKLFKRKGHQRRGEKNQIFPGPESIVLPLLLPGQASERPRMNEAPV